MRDRHCTLLMVWTQFVKIKRPQWVVTVSSLMDTLNCSSPLRVDKSVSGWEEDGISYTTETESSSWNSSLSELHLFTTDCAISHSICLSSITFEPGRSCRMCPMEKSGARNLLGIH